MNIKNFAVGQTIYVLQMNTGRNIEPIIRESTVTKIGRKYITIKNDTRYQTEEWFECGLVEGIDWGERSLLCKTKQDALDCIEKFKLQKWIRNTKSKTYTLAQLRAVKNILEPEEDNV
jgi:hypothetical protein